MKRIIPVLLISDGGLVKSVKFKNHKYIGDPINAVKIFNDKEVDEIAILDIDASKKGLVPNIKMISEIASEAFMPLSYGGGISRIEEVRDILFEGVEKVILNSVVINNPKLIAEISKRFGSSSTVVSIDVKKNIFGKPKIYSYLNKKFLNVDIIEHVKNMVNLGAGEIFINSVDQDGTFNGFDSDLVKTIATAIDIPLIACGGASCENDLVEIIVKGKASAAAAGSMFVYQNKNRAVLINYPNWTDMQLKIKNLSNEGI